MDAKCFDAGQLRWLHNNDVSEEEHAKDMKLEGSDVGM